MKKNFAATWIGLVGLGLSLGWADSTIEKSVPFSPIPTKIWTKGPKQRTEISIPFFGNGTSVIIIRADKGVQWTLNMDSKTYFESSITVPYNPSQPNIPNAAARSNPNCTTVIDKTRLKKTISGIPVTGVREWCKETPEQKRLHWYAPSTGLAAAVQKEQSEFSKMQMGAMYAHYPEDSRKKMEKFSEQVQNPMVGRLSEKDRKKWPKGLEMAMENEVAGKSTTAYEITKISADPIDDSVFEIPEGFKKSDVMSTLLEKMGQKNGTNTSPQKPKQPITK